MHYVYLIITKNSKKIISYVGYTNDLDNRILHHNSSKGAKFTRGRTWKLIYYKTYENLSIALKEEYKLKKNFRLRKKIKENYIKNENFSSPTI